MATIDVDHLEVFAAVVRSGSFTRAARTLGTQKAHASRVVSRLERDLGVRLLSRTTRSLTVTEAGHELYVRVLGILAALDDTRVTLQRAQREPQGVLKLTCGVEFGLLVVNRWIGELLARFPKIRVEADFSTRVVDLIQEGFDVAIRIGTLADSGLSLRKIGDITYALYASPGYLEARSAPASPADLVAHDLVMFAPAPPPRWRLVHRGERFTVTGPPRLVVNNNLAARDAAAAGLGIALLPRFQAAPAVAEARLVEVLPGWTRAPAPVHVVFASSRYVPPKVRAFIDIARAGAVAW